VGPGLPLGRRSSMPDTHAEGLLRLRRRRMRPRYLTGVQVDSFLEFERLTVGRLDDAGRQAFHEESMVSAELLRLPREAIPPTVPALRGLPGRGDGQRHPAHDRRRRRVADLIANPPDDVPGGRCGADRVPGLPDPARAAPPALRRPRRPGPPGPATGQPPRPAGRPPPGPRGSATWPRRSWPAGAWRAATAPWPKPPPTGPPANPWRPPAPGPAAGPDPAHRRPLPHRPSPFPPPRLVIS
jgi:hypothetical protein